MQGFLELRSNPDRADPDHCTVPAIHIVQLYIQNIDQSYVFLLLQAPIKRGVVYLMTLLSDQKIAGAHSINLDEESSSRQQLDINLRASCLDCKFLLNCKAVEERSSPDRDALIGLYRFNALTDRCLI